jgi:hypothetical protein
LQGRVLLKNISSLPLKWKKNDDYNQSTQPNEIKISLGAKHVQLAACPVHCAASRVLEFETDLARTSPVGRVGLFEEERDRAAFAREHEAWAKLEDERLIAARHARQHSGDHDDDTGARGPGTRHHPKGHGGSGSGGGNSSSSSISVSLGVDASTTQVLTRDRGVNATVLSRSEGVQTEADDWERPSEVARAFEGLGFELAQVRAECDRLRGIVAAQQEAATWREIVRSSSAEEMEMGSATRTRLFQVTAERDRLREELARALELHTLEVEALKERAAFELQNLREESERDKKVQKIENRMDKEMHGIRK